jgi:hypothetical protein
MSPAPLIRLYPRAWRARYGEEMEAVLDAAAGAHGIREAADLVRGALDAWLHPPTPSWLPASAALAGGGLWTVVAAAILAQPSPPDWPGYLIDLVPIALVAASALLVATLGCALRAGDDGGRLAIAGSAATVLGAIAWIVALALTIAGHADGATLAATQALAVLGMTAIGLVLLRAGDQIVGWLLLCGSVAMLIPWTGGWLVFGAAWTCIGIYLVVEHLSRATGDPITS